MSENNYQGMTYFTSCQDGSISPMHSQVAEPRQVQVLDISQPVAYDSYIPQDRGYGRHFDPVYIRKDEDRLDRKERLAWEMDTHQMDREVKSVCLPSSSLKLDPDRYESPWGGLDLNKPHYDPLSIRSDPKMGLNTIPVSPYLQVAERFVSELSERKPDPYVDSQVDTRSHNAVDLNILSTSVVQGEQGGVAEDRSSPKQEQQPMLEEEESAQYSMYPSVNTATASSEGSVIINNMLNRTSSLQTNFNQDMSHDPSSSSSSNPSVQEPQEERFPCNSCEKIFASKQKLSVHKRMHRQKSVAERKAAATPGNSARNEEGSSTTDQDGKIQTENDEKNAFVCLACGRGFPLKMALACHMRYHAEERTYTCADCHQTFTSRWVRSPSLCDKCRHGPCAKPVPKPCRCERCGKCFKDARLLRDHTRSHTGERPFACPTCGKTFAQSGTLYRHRQVHSDSRPYRCTQCNKSYKLKGHLTVHIKSHTM